MFDAKVTLLRRLENVQFLQSLRGNLVVGMQLRHGVDSDLPLLRRAPSPSALLEFWCDSIMGIIAIPFACKVMRMLLQSQPHLVFGEIASLPRRYFHHEINFK